MFEVLPWIVFLAAVAIATYFTIRWRTEFKQSNWWTGLAVEGRRVTVGVDQSLCMGASSCVELAPDVFRLDWTKRKSTFDPAPLEQITKEALDPERIFKAAQSCPYRAIFLEDAGTRDRIFP